MVDRKSLIWGNLGRGAPGSWLLMRARDGRILSLSETCGGVLKSAHAMWLDLDASETDARGVRFIHDRDGALVAAAVPRAEEQRIRGELAQRVGASAPKSTTRIRAAKPALTQPIERPAREPRENRSTMPPKIDRSAKRVTSRATTNTTSKTSDSASNASATLHIVTPAAVRAQIESLRDAMEAATTIRPTTTDVVRRALEMGLSSLASRFDSRFTSNT